MKTRTFNLRIRITNDAGKTTYYSIRPVGPADVGPSVVAFLLQNLSKDPSPLYMVAVEPSGLAMCDCPQHAIANKCKHLDALMAAGVLPSALLSALQLRTKQLDEAAQMLKASEAQSQRLAEAHMAERTVYEHDANDAADRIAYLEGEVSALAERCQRLQTEVAAYHARRPSRRRPAKKEAA